MIRPLGILAGISACTCVAFYRGLNLASTGFLDLGFVLLTAVYCGFWEATAISILAFLSLDYFFVPPLFKWTVADPQNWLALGAFECAALVVSRLSHQARMKTAEAIAQRQDSERLYQASRQILLLDRSRDPGDWIPSLICELFDIPGVVLFDATSPAAHVHGHILPGTEERTRDAYYANADRFEPSLQTWFCTLRFGMRPVGALALCNCKLSPLVATALASISAVALERRRSFERELRAEACREGEQLRAAVLDALAHEFKTPLSTIRVASSGLLTLGGLAATQTELVTMIDDEATSLNSLASCLLQTARLDSVEQSPMCEPLMLSTVIPMAIQASNRRATERFQVNISAGETPVLADRKLITTALTQIFDNAIKYSTPGSPIRVGVESREREAILTVHNHGLSIGFQERDRIFERFYRGSRTQQHLPGAGLGLSIVKRIVDAHQGRVWVQGDPESGTTFLIALPAAVKG